MFIIYFSSYFIVTHTPIVSLYPGYHINSLHRKFINHDTNNTFILYCSCSVNFSFTLKIDAISRYLLELFLDYYYDIHTGLSSWQPPILMLWKDVDKLEYRQDNVDNNRKWCCKRYCYR